jgi:adenine deaminase
MEAIRMGSLNAASYLGKTHEVGSLSPGRIAFINLVDDLRCFEITKVVYGEQIVAENGLYVDRLEKYEFPESFYNTIQLPSKIEPEDLEVMVENGDSSVKIRTMGWNPKTIPYDETIVEMKVKEGKIEPSAEKDVAKVVLIERQPDTGKIGRVFCQGYGIKRGAVGCSYHVNSCYMGVVGMNDEDIALVANRLAELGGGLVAAADGKILAEIPMPIAGLVTDEPAEKIIVEMQVMKKIIKEELGLWQDEEGLFLLLSFLFIPYSGPKMSLSVDGLVWGEFVDGKLDMNPIPMVVGDEG